MTSDVSEPPATDKEVELARVAQRCLMAALTTRARIGLRW